MLRRILPLAALFLLAAHGAAVGAQESQKAEDKQKPEATQTPQATPAPAATPKQGASPKATAARYWELLDKLKRGERDVDFTELRMSYTETADYNPYGDNSDARRAMFAALRTSKWDDALSQSAKILEKNYADIDGHVGAYSANRQRGDAAKADFHKYVFLGLIESVRSGGDGSSAERAIVVISTDEEYALLSFLGLQRTNQALLNSGGHAYDRLAAVDPETKKTYYFYFRIDIPFGWLGRSLKK
ncbi:MAG TPA: DUF4919 domain-containing protein [Pyrinomonadaceae bacterium]|nr:DUF4919 domain-containing protein [Pyrinomonadaceae bacterium]